MTEQRPDVVAVGLTGGIGAGKSTALSLFGEFGALVLSADAVVHDLYAREDCRAALVAHFGPSVLDAGGDVDRRSLAGRVHGRPEELRWLEGLTHPLVRAGIEAFIEAALPGSVIVCEVPLLVESGLEDLFDLVVTVEAASDTRRDRSVHRFGAEMFAELEGLQASSEQRVAASDLAFFNDGELERLRVFVREAHARAAALLPEES